MAAPPAKAKAAERSFGPPLLATTTKPKRDDEQTELAMSNTAVWPRWSIMAPWRATPKALPTESAAA
jgi:hypothetical protein